ncbi:MAG: hypothetical protein ABFD69_00720 [Candidatus Sumerlaeia bacterium]
MLGLKKLDSKEDWTWIEALIDRTMKESMLLEQASQYFEPKPASLFASKEVEDRINKNFNALNRQMGGAPDIFIISEGAKMDDVYDNFCWNAIIEMTSLFWRTRNNVIKTHAYFITRSITESPEAIECELSQDVRAAMSFCAKEEFWNNSEIAYIRLASLWDRVGQLLDYVFFNIRQYERDGFPTVLDRIKANYVPVDKQVEKCAFWKGITNYAYNEDPYGMKWLLRRRNLLIHSIHLCEPSRADENELKLKFHYNHLAESVKNKLKAMLPHEEVNCLHNHLARFSDLFEPISELCLWGNKLLSDMRKEKDSWIRNQENV